MKTLSDITQSLKNYFATGFLHEAINISNTNIYKMFAAISQVFYREAQAEEYFKRELNPETTYDLIDDWEKEVGIPSDCFTTNISIEQRRKQVLVKLTANVQTLDDFKELALTLGVNVDIYPKNVGVSAGFPLVLPYTLANIDDNYVLVVDILGWSATGGLPLELAYILGGRTYQAQIQCLFDKLKPANVEIEYI